VSISQIGANSGPLQCPFSRHHCTTAGARPDVRIALFVDFSGAAHHVRTDARLREGSCAAAARFRAHTRTPTPRRARA
jgi:hypothetical protein